MSIWVNFSIDDVISHRVYKHISDWVHGHIFFGGGLDRIRIRVAEPVFYPAFDRSFEEINR